MRYLHSRIGSRNDMPCVYWTDTSVQCIIGCFRGDLDELGVKVEETHKDNKQHYDDYMEFISICRMLIANTTKEITK